MRTLFVVILGIFVFAIISGLATHSAPRPIAANVPAESRPGEAADPVIVELFTSEGCSDCPPADRLLARLEETQPVAGAEIIALEEHVDYWDSLGWKDPFSSASFTDRQSSYVRSLHGATPYTPQMVVDGVTGFVGSDERTAMAVIAKAARVSKATITLDLMPGSAGDALRIRVAPSPNLNSGDDVLLAVTENGLSSNVTRGENSGATLAHRAVVRELRVIGQVAANGTFSAEPDLNLAKNWQRENTRAVVFVQERSTGRVLGAASVTLRVPAAGNGS